jgi:hypothetical protein
MPIQFKFQIILLLTYISVNITKMQISYDLFCLHNQFKKKLFLKTVFIRCDINNGLVFYFKSNIFNFEMIMILSSNFNVIIKIEDLNKTQIIFQTKIHNQFLGLE